ncbi:MAG: NUDIX hydrolase [Bdellovibrionales bacterium]|nr:NUDIX hydrolase [Bdellovibrionales bacterium]
MKNKSDIQVQDAGVESLHISEGAGVLLIVHNHVLLVQMNYGKFKGQWILPGGLVEETEHPHMAAVRECFEETGLRVELRSLLAVRHRIFKNGNKNIYYVFEAHTGETPLSTPFNWDRGELLDVRFWPVSEALTNSKVRDQTKHYISLGLGGNSSQLFMESLVGSNDDYCYVGVL